MSNAILNNDLSGSAPRLRAELVHLCNGDRNAALMLDYFCLGRIEHDNCNEFENWQNRYRPRPPYYQSADPWVIAQNTGNLLSTKETVDALNHLLRLKFIRVNPSDRSQVTLNVGYLAELYKSTFIHA